MRCDGEQLLEGSCAGEAELTLILAAARTAVDAMDSTLDIEASVLRLSDMAAVSPREAAVLIARGRVPKEDTCTRYHLTPLNSISNINSTSMHCWNGKQTSHVYHRCYCCQHYTVKACKRCRVKRETDVALAE